jgi:hypothetical protein
MALVSGICNCASVFYSASCFACGIFKHGAWYSQEINFLLYVLEKYIRKKYHIAVIKEDEQHGIYIMAGRLSGVWLVLGRRRRRLRSLGAWWSLINERNIIRGALKITLTGLCRRCNLQFYWHNRLLRQGHIPDSYILSLTKTILLGGGCWYEFRHSYSPLNKKLLRRISVSDSHNIS